MVDNKHMDLYEFELRLRAYKGLKYKFKLDWDEETLVNLVKITNKGVPDRKLQELSPSELQEITLETFTDWKKSFLEKHKYTKVGNADLGTYITRLEYELKVIKEMGFNSYFLIVADFVRRAKKNMIVVGPGRGSGAGSLLAWVIRITDIDPMEFGLLFERFLNPARVSMPDFDIDFEDTLREKVIEYVTEKYGAEKVCSIGTYMKMATKAAFKDAARAVGIPFDISNQISNLMPDGMSINEAIKGEGNDELKTIYEGNDKVKDAADFGGQLEGNMRQLGVHACGVIIAPEEITTYSPIQYVKETDHNLVSQYDGPTLENIGLLKMDFLGLRNLSIIKNCIKIIKARYEKEGKELPEMFEGFFKNTSFEPPMDDNFTFENVFQTGNTTGIFQFESEGMRRFLIQLKANSINDLVAMNALYRPGPMEFIPTYIHRKHGEEEVTYMHADLRKVLLNKYNKQTVEDEQTKLTEDLGPIMDLTYGIAVYQEQLMFLVQSMAGFSLAEADLLRRGVGKKKKEVIEQLKKEFIDRGQKHRDYKPETTKYIYEKMIEPAASYSFNKSHSVCYAWIAYQTAYLKAHFPVAFYAALIRSVEEDTDELSNYIYEAQLHGIPVLPPDINESFNHVAAVDSTIGLGFLGIKGIGFEIGEFIQQERKNGEYKDLGDFLKRCQKVINKKSLEALIKAGSLDKFFDRKTLFENRDYLLEWTKSSQSMSQGLFGMDESVSQISFQKEYTSTMMERLMMEQDVFKRFVSAHPLDGLYPFLKKFSFISQFKNTENAGAFIITGYISNIQRAKKKGFFVEVEDISAKTEFFFRDMLDFKKFDVVIIYGFKGRSSTVDKIIKTSREQLIKRAGGKFDPEFTVTKARGLRSGKMLEEQYNVKEDKKSKKIEETKKDNKASDIQSDCTIDDPNCQVDPSRIEELAFGLPDDIGKIHKIMETVQTHTGDIKISIGPKEFEINEKGLEIIKDLLS